MPRRVRALETVDLEANRLIQRLASGTESGSSSREHCHSWRLARRCFAAVGSVAAATVPGAARIERNNRRTTVAHHRGSCSPPVGGRTHRATRVQLHHTRKDILSSGRFATTDRGPIRAPLCRPSRGARSNSPTITIPLTGRAGHTTFRSHMTTTTPARSRSYGSLYVIARPRRC